ncbi:MAG TPA: choice-of-anchor D domain-containing protein [Acidimicrobiales bacterium]|nr:choice-of-anchor D domain-containing protein [Acidimicrobiales bacterium]
MRIGRLVGIAVVLAAVGGVTTAAGAATSTGSAKVVNDASSPFGAGRTVNYSTVHAQGSQFNENVVLDLSGPTGDLSVSLSAPEGQSLGVGTYAAGSRGSDFASLSVSTAGQSSCGSGTFTVYDAAFGGTAVVQRFAVEFNAQCSTTGSGVHGEIWFNSTVGMPTLPTPRTLYGTPWLTSNGLSRFVFDDTPVGGVSTSLTITISNDSTNIADITAVATTAVNPNDFIGQTDCSTRALAPGQHCTVQIWFAPAAPGLRQATLDIYYNEPEPLGIHLIGTGTQGYYEASASGSVWSYGNAVDFGDMSTQPLNAPVVSMAVTPYGYGYWLLGADGGIFNFGDAQFYGSTGGMTLNKPVIAMAPTPTGTGYWLAASDGGIFAFGTAGFYGSTGGMQLNQPIVGMAATPDGKGYWLVASDGGIFAFGDAQFYGSTGATPLNQPIVGMAATPDGGGYWLVASDGGIFAFGDAQFYGSTGGVHLDQPIVGMAATPTGAGYWFTAADGGIFTFGRGLYYGSNGGTTVHDVVAMTASAGPTLQAIFDIPAVRPQLRPGWTPVT